MEFNDRSRARTIEGKDKKRNSYESGYAFYEAKESILNAFKSGLFPIKATKGEGLKY